MRIVLVNVPHLAIGSRVPHEHLPPLGLLSIGGPLLDAGHEVSLIDAEFGPMPHVELVQAIVSRHPQAVLFGHSGSSSAHPIISEVASSLRVRLPDVSIIYGGVFPTFEYRTILEAEAQFDVVVRGEGEQTAPKLVEALQRGRSLHEVPGIAFRERGKVIATAKAAIISNLDTCRIGWELINFSRYSYYGKRPAVVMQFSRGCNHECTFCGQHQFWRKYRHRDPVLFAREIARLHREQGVQLVNLADETPTADRNAWQAFCEALIAQNVPVTIIGSMRADHVVRDRDILHLYRKAGCERFLLGIENTDEATLKRVRKGGRINTDKEAIRLLREHGIISLATWVADFEKVSDRSLFRSMMNLMSYDPDQITALYATPHKWTKYYREVKDRVVVQTDKRLWDYKHQVLKAPAIPSWRLMLWVKMIEVILQARPKALWRTFFHADAVLRRGMQWYSRIGRRVWFYEWHNYLFIEKRVTHGPTVEAFLRTPVFESETCGSSRTCSYSPKLVPTPFAARISE